MDAIAEHLQTRSAAGLFDFSFMGLYELDAAEKVARVQSRNPAAIERGRAAYTLLLNDDGSVFNDATVWNLGDGRWWLFTGRPGDFAWVRERASARDRSGEHAILALQGPSSGRILARLVGEELVRQLRYFHFVESGSMCIARLGYSGEIGYELLIAKPGERRLADSLLELGRPEGLCECSFAAANSLRIESGYVLFDREIDGRANPRELGLEKLVASPRRFDLTRKLAGLQIVEQPADSGLPSAQVTSECAAPTLGMRVALGFVPAQTAVGTLLRVADRRTAKVTALPFYDPKKSRPRAVPL